jgi:hypothetical protein
VVIPADLRDKLKDGFCAQPDRSTLCFVKIHHPHAALGRGTWLNSIDARVNSPEKFHPVHRNFGHFSRPIGHYIVYLIILL